MIQACILAFEVFVAILIIYTVYKIIWYTIKMLSFKRKIKNINSDTVKVEFRRGLFQIVFGKKGYVDFVVTTPNGSFAISVISFISTHSRWNIEKTRTRFFIESRRGSSFFYKMHVNSNVPDHVREYKNEIRISRKELTITPIDKSFGEQIFLLYPYPKKITYTDANYNELFVGNKVEGHVIMDIKAFNRLLFEEEES